MKNILTAFLLLTSLGLLAQGERQSGNSGYKYRLRGDTIYTTDPLKIKNATTNAAPTYIASYGSDGLITKTIATYFGGSGGGSGLTSRLVFTVATDLTSTFQSDSLIGKDAEIDGRTFNDSVNNGFTLNKTTGTIRFYPVLLAGEKVTVNYGTYTTTFVGGGSTPTLAYVNWATINSGSGANYNSTTHTLNGGTDCSNNPHDYAMGDKYIPAGQDGYLLYQYASTTDNIVVGFNTSGTNEKEDNGTAHTYEAALLVLSTGMYVYDNHLANNGVAGSIPLTSWIKINRMSGVVTAQVAPDVSGSPGAFTTFFTFTNTSGLATSNLYPQANFGCFTSPANIQIYNAQ